MNSLLRFKSKIKPLIRRITHPSSRYSPLSTIPFARDFGCHRGTPIDRFYIETFLNNSKKYINGTVLEIAENTYTKKFSTNSKSLVLAPYEGSNIDVVCDLTATIPTSNREIADCFICVQTLNFIYDYKKALENIKLLMRENGTILITVAGVCQISEFDAKRWGDYFRFTPQSLTKILTETFPHAHISIESFGNIRAATGLLHGLVVEDINTEDLEYKDSTYPVIISAIVKL